MLRCSGVVFLLAGLFCLPVATPSRLPACCPVGPQGKPVVNADQTVVILWDAAKKTQHFIRKASFQSQADDFAFLIPTPTQPELEESGNDVFPFLQKLTEPEVQRVQAPRGGGGCGCADYAAPKAAGLANANVDVLERKQVAGFNAVVLAAESADALVEWLNENGYEFSPEAKAWAQPYIDGGWMITALKVAKDEEGHADQGVAASALRLSFQTDRPLFPYREPDSGASAESLGINHRLLRIYCIAEAKYRGDLTEESRWTGKVAWADKIKPSDKAQALELLKLPADTGPEEWWMTEFEDDWAYRVAPADVYFVKAANQSIVKRPPIIQYVSTGATPDLIAGAFAFVLIAGPALRRKLRRRRS
jgi:hypothetical protein